MTILKFTGTPRQVDSIAGVSISIDNRDVVDEIAAATWNGPVTVGIADERFTGDLFVESGWGYSEYTPIEPDQLRIGPHNLIDVLGRYIDSGEITVWVADEPIDLLSDESLSERTA